MIAWVAREIIFLQNLRNENYITCAHQAESGAENIEKCASYLAFSLMRRVDGNRIWLLLATEVASTVRNLPPQVEASRRRATSQMLVQFLRSMPLGITAGLIDMQSPSSAGLPNAQFVSVKGIIHSPDFNSVWN